MKNKTPKPKHPGGRPTDYTLERVTEICRIIANNPIGLKKLCKMFDVFPETKDTLYDWLHKYPEFANLYAQAKSKQVDRHVEYCIDLTDDALDAMADMTPGNVMTVRMAIDTRKWYASKLAPKIYGDKLQIEEKTEENEALKEEVKKLRTKLDKKNKRDY